MWHKNTLYNRQDDIPLHRIDSVRLETEPATAAVSAAIAAGLI